jgi:ArsR family transcriptional regulator, arsenate/arsenite/antimonite-responsive transcriptional repressor
MSDETIEETVKIAKLLGDSNRLKIIQLLSKQSLCVHAIVNYLNISQPAVSKHLKLLVDAGILSSEKKGMFVHYSFKKDAFEKYKINLDKIIKK